MTHEAIDQAATFAAELERLADKIASFDKPGAFYNFTFQSDQVAAIIVNAFDHGFLPLSVRSVIQRAIDKTPAGQNYRMNALGAVYQLLMGMVENSFARDATVARKIAAMLRDGNREQPSSSNTGDGPRPEATINMRMLAALTKNPDCRNWSAQQFATHLDCSKSTVIATDAWKSLKVVKGGIALERLAESAARQSRRRNREA